MFRRWFRTWAVLKSIILRHLFGRSSVVFIDWIEELAAAPDSVDQREVKADLELGLASAFLPNHKFRNFYGKHRDATLIQATR
jgi:hypothetical protein